MEKKNKKPITCNCNKCTKEYSKEFGKGKKFIPKQYTMFTYKEMEGKL